jgi:hypothetical protein
MKLRQLVKADESGQTLVWVAVGMIILMGILALVVDVGHLYAERRKMQNAADAAALEAARYLCFQAQDRTAAAAAGRAYALSPHNLAQDAAVTIPGDGWTATADASENATTYFARVFGISSVPVHATAKAACGPTNKACGLFPLAFDIAQWDKVTGSCGRKFYVWSGDDPTGPDCTLCNCDTDNDGQAEIFPGTGRAWLDFSEAVKPLDPLYPIDPKCLGTGCGTSGIKCWISNDNPAPITIPQCISGDSGVKPGARNEIEARAKSPYPGNIVKVPLFANRCASSNGCKEGFNVTDFGCIQVLGWVQELQLYEKTKPTSKCWDGKVIQVAVSCDTAACESTCGGTTGGGCSGDPAVCSVSLVP